MEEILFLTGSALCIAATSAAYGMNYWHEAERPMSPKPFMWLMNIAGSLGVIMIIGGFFIYSWWLPLVSLFLGTNVWKLLEGRARKMDAGPGLILVTGSVGVVISLVVVVTAATNLGWI